MKKLSLFILLISYSALALAQLGGRLKSLSNKLIEVADNIAGEVEDEKEEGTRTKEFDEMQLKQLRKDTTYYNLTLAQAEKVAFFNNRDDNQNIFLVVAKNYEDEYTIKPPLYTYEKAFDENRAGTNALLINRKLALYSFQTALGFYIDAEETLDALITDKEVSIESFIPPSVSDTLNTPDLYAITKIFLNLSILYHSVGQYQHAELLNRSLIPFIKENIGATSRALVSNYNNLAMIERDLGNYTDAEEYLSLAVETLRSMKKSSPLDLSVLLNNQAMLNQELGRYDLAIQAIDESLSIAKEEIGNKGTDFSKLRINKALILKTQKKYEEAEVLLLELKKIRERRLGKRHQDYADIESVLASVYMDQREWSKVESLLLHALDVYEAKFSKAHPTYTSTLRNLAQYYRYTGSLGEALSTSLEVKALISENFGETHPDYLQSLEDLSMVQWKRGEVAEAQVYFEDANRLKLELLEQFFPALSENEKAKFWSKMRPGIMQFYAFATENYETSPELLVQFYNMQLATKGILLSTTSKVRAEILASDNEVLKADYLRWVDLKEELASYYTLSKEALREQGISISDLEAKANSLEKSLGKSSSKFAEANSLQSATVNSLLESLKPNEAAVEIIRVPVFNDELQEEIKYVALILDKNGQIKLAQFDNGVDMEGKLAKLYRKSIQYKVADNQSYNNYWAPIATHLKGINTTYVSLDGVYNQINLNTLKAPSGKYVDDEQLLITLSSTRDIAKLNRQTAINKHMLMFGFPDYGDKGEVAPLPGTKVELEIIGKLAKDKGLNVDQYYQQEANESLFKSKIDNPEILHIATHGFFLTDLGNDDGVVFGVEVTKAKENPLLRSGLLLANAENAISNVNVSEVSSADNGILTAFEAMTLNLNDTKMVVLSACETGLGETKSGEGVYGLQRAFQIAGAETVVMSLWKVDDAATQALMTNFYEEWLETGDKLGSFKLAQQKLRQQYEEPYYWGAFVMMN